MKIILSLAITSILVAGCVDKRNKVKDTIEYSSAYSIIQDGYEWCKDKHGSSTNRDVLLEYLFNFASTVMAKKLSVDFLKISLSGNDPARKLDNAQYEKCINDIGVTYDKVFGDILADVILEDALKTCDITLKFPNLVQHPFSGEPKPSNTCIDKGVKCVSNQKNPFLYTLNGTYMKEVKKDKLRDVVKNKDEDKNKEVEYIKEFTSYSKEPSPDNKHFYLEVPKYKTVRKNGEIGFGEWLNREHAPEHIFVRAEVEIKNFEPKKTDDDASTGNNATAKQDPNSKPPICKLDQRYHKILLVARQYGHQEWYITGRTLSTLDASRPDNGTLILDYPTVSIPLIEKIGTQDYTPPTEKEFSPRDIPLDRVKNFHEFRVVVVNTLGKNYNNSAEIGSNEIQNILNYSQIAPRGESWAIVYDNLKQVAKKDEKSLASSGPTQTEEKNKPVKKAKKSFNAKEATPQKTARNTKPINEIK